MEEIEVGENVAAAAGNPSFLTSLMPFLLMFGVLYLLIIRPQQKQKKTHQQMLSALKVNDKVVMNSGIIDRKSVV